MKQLKYLVIGTGGVGGSIAGFLALSGRDVSCIARGTHYEEIKKRGMNLVSTIKGNVNVPVKIFTSENYDDKADVVFVCVKGYSIDSIAEQIRKASHENTLVIPILNVYGTGKRIKSLVPEVNVLDGCIYIVAFISSPGEITQMGTVFRLIYGVPKGLNISSEMLERIRFDLTESGIKAIISDDIDRDTFIKWSYISAMACTGAYFDAPMGELQKAGNERDVFIGLSEESTAIGRKLGISLPDDMLSRNLAVLDSLDPESTASLQKDLKKSNESELKGLLFDMIDIADKVGVDIPVYRMVAGKFR